MAVVVRRRNLLYKWVVGEIKKVPKNGSVEARFPGGHVASAMITETGEQNRGQINRVFMYSDTYLHLFSMEAFNFRFSEKGTRTSVD